MTPKVSRGRLRRSAEEAFGPLQSRRRHLEGLVSERMGSSLSMTPPSSSDAALQAALHVAGDLTAAQADMRAAELLGYLNSHHLISRPSEVSPSDAGTRMGFGRVLSRFGTAVGMAGITLGAFPQPGPRSTPGTLSKFIEIRLPMSGPFFPVPIFLALQTHLEAVDLTGNSPLPIHFTFQKDGEPVPAPFAEKWANDLLEDFNSAK